MATTVALIMCASANVAANRRVTFSRRGRAGRRRHYGTGLALAALPLALSLATLIVLSGLGVTSVAADLVAVTVVNALATLARFVLLRRWVFR